MSKVKIKQNISLKGASFFLEAGTIAPNASPLIMALFSSYMFDIVLETFLYNAFLYV